jgi:transposase-like protein
MAGRPAAPININANVLSAAEVAEMKVTPRELYAIMSDKREWLQWLARHRLIRNNVDCGTCHRPMSLVGRAECSDGFSWRCRQCNTRSSIRTGSFFANCELKTEQILMMMYYWIHEVQSKHVMLFESLVSWDTIVNYNNYFRKECYEWFHTTDQMLGGFDDDGQSVFVEMDESYFLRRKYHRGQRRRGQWVVGLVERGSGRCWLEVVARRDAPTLERIISDHVLPGTTIVTDAWRGYQNVGALNNGVYDHAVIIHANEFVHSDDHNIHTESIEGLWMRAKRKLRYQCGTSRGLFASYLVEFQWRNMHKHNVFGCYLQMLSINYHI